MDVLCMNAIDLFCGCGGISLGIQQAGLNVLAGIDINKKYIQTFSHNFSSAKTYCDDLRILTPKDFNG